MSKILLEKRIEMALLQIKSELNLDLTLILQEFLPSLGKVELTQIENNISNLDHIALLFPSMTDINKLSLIAKNCGFSHQQQVFPSTIVAKELAVLSGLEVVKTIIFKAYHDKNTNSGIEIFVPHANSKLVNGWIKDGVANHIALQVNSYAAIEQIQNILNHNTKDNSNFSSHQIQDNTHEGSTILYHNSTQKMRLEFFFKQ